VAKLAVKQESDFQIHQRCEQLETQVKEMKGKEEYLNKTISKCEHTIRKQRSTIDDLQAKIDELDAFKMTTLDNTVHKLAEQEGLFYSLLESERIRKAQDQHNQPVPTMSVMSFNPSLEEQNQQKEKSLIY
jgi:predicted nuclease with TOPRIM domain